MSPLIAVSPAAVQQIPSLPVLKVVGTKRSHTSASMPSERAAKKRQKLDPQEDDPKRQRGRPRVDGQDETAADVSI